VRERRTASDRQSEIRPRHHSCVEAAVARPERHCPGPGAVRVGRTDPSHACGGVRDAREKHATCGGAPGGRDPASGTAAARPSAEPGRPGGPGDVTPAPTPHASLSRVQPHRRCPPGLKPVWGATQDQSPSLLGRKGIAPSVPLRGWRETTPHERVARP
jgi:hypothetical protein